AAMIETLDESVGRVMAKLDELELSDNTVVVLFSDNGGLIKRFDGEGPVVTSNAPLRSEKGSCWEGGIRDPLIVRWPGVVKPGAECDAPVSSVDFYPTMLDIAGLTGDPEHALDGASIVPLLAQRGELERDAIYWHYPHYHHTAPCGSVRDDEFKLIEFYEDGALELYNLREDIGEENNLAGKAPKKAAELRERLSEWRKSVNAKMPTPNEDYDPARAHLWGKRRRKPAGK
ncbi:MAG: sulfatase/phosphatase domain-containing protein, partial [Armatimonadota bacterium]